MRNSFKVLAATAVIVAIACGVYLWKQSAPISATEKPIASAPVNTPTPNSSSVRYPVPGEPNGAAKKVLPTLNESDSTFEESLTELFDKKLIESIFNLTDLIRKMVVVIENATEKTIPLELSPFRPFAGNFKVVPKEGKLWIDAKNDQRYLPLITLVQAADPKKIAGLYFQFYPLFQAAYREVNAKGYFNDRAIQVIDHLLSTPPVPAPIEVVALNQSYHYADANLENLSASQKALLRLGSENSEIVKERLRKLRNLLILGQ